MSLSTQQRKSFVDSYSRAVLTSWADEAYVQRLQQDPRAALAEVNLDLPAGATIDVVRHEGTSVDQGSGDLSSQVALYEEGLRTGRFVLHFPETPQIDTSELDTSELTSVSAGTEYCCCCCPSCSSCSI